MMCILKLRIKNWRMRYIKLIINYQESKYNNNYTIFIKMKIKDIFLKFGKILPFIAFTVGIDSNLMARDNKRARLEVASSEHKQLLDRLRDTQDMIVSDEIVRNKIAGLTAQGLETSENARYHMEQMQFTVDLLLKELAKKLDEADVDQTQVDYIKGLLKQHTDQASDALEKSNTTLQEIIDSIVGPGSSSNNFVDSLNSILESYKSFLSTLNIEQLNAIVNF